jgi:hypothetical protein
LKHLTTINIGHSQLNDADAKALASLGTVTRLDVVSSDLTREGFRSILGMKQLTYLSLGSRGLDLDSSGEQRVRRESIAGLERLVTLRIRGHRFGDHLLREVAEIKSLREFEYMPDHGSRLEHHQYDDITDKGIAALCRHQDLESVALSTVRLTDESLRDIGRLERLTRLQLIGCEGRKREATTAGWKHIGQLKHLKELSLTHQVTDADVKEIMAGPAAATLERLELRINGITDEALEAIARASKIGHLDVSYNAIAGSGIPHLATLRNLRTLDIGWNKVTPVFAEDLGRLRQLKTLNYQAQNVKPEWLYEHSQRVRSLLPNCDVSP